MFSKETILTYHDKIILNINGSTNYDQLNSCGPMINNYKKILKNYLYLIEPHTVNHLIYSLDTNFQNKRIHIQNNISN